MPFTITPEALHDEILLRLGDAAQSIWSAAEVDSYVAEGYNRFVIATRALWRQLPLADVAGQAVYTLPPELDQIERATWNDMVIEPLTRARAEQTDPYFETRSGDVTNYMLEADGLRTLRKIGIPVANDPAKFQLEYTRRPVPPTATTPPTTSIVNGDMESWGLPPSGSVSGWSELGATFSVRVVGGGVGGSDAAGISAAPISFSQQNGISQDILAASGQRRHFEVSCETFNAGTDLAVTVQNLATGNYLQLDGTWGALSPPMGNLALVGTSAFLRSVVHYTVESSVTPLVPMTLRIQVGFPSDTQSRNTIIDNLFDYPTFELHDHYLKYLKWFACWKALEREGPGQNLAAADHYRGRYQRGVVLTLSRHEAFRRSYHRMIGGGGVSDRVPGIAPPAWPSNFGRTIRYRPR